MIMQEYDEAKLRNMFRKEAREEAREEGRQEGRQEGRFELLVSMVEDNEITIESAAKRAGMEVTEFVNAMKQHEAGESIATSKKMPL